MAEMWHTSIKKTRQPMLPLQSNFQNLKWKFEKLLNTAQLNVSPAWDEFTAQVAKQVIQEIHCRTQDRILGSLHRNMITLNNKRLTDSGSAHMAMYFNNAYSSQQHYMPP